MSRPPIRALIAIDLDERLKRELTRIQQRLSKAEADIKWTAPKNMHLTVKFLGDIAPEHVDTIEGALSDIADRFPSFHMDIGMLGAFPNTELPKIIWAGVTKRANILEQIARDLDDDLKGIATAPSDNNFLAHITIGHARTAKGLKQLSTLLKDTQPPSGLSQKVQRITLFRSELFPKGAVYHTLCTKTLGEDQ
jgi:RNA 2',3'-cyclic 3'-phosphodiesterase